MSANEAEPLLSHRSVQSRVSVRDDSTQWVSTGKLARLVTFSTSFSEGWDFAIFIVVLLPVKEEFQLSAIETGLLSAMPILGGILGFCVVGFCMDGIGRKPTIVLTNVAASLGCLIMAVSPSAFVFGFARTLLAFALKSGLVAVTVYMAELSAAKHRGILVSLEEIFLNIGVVACVATGWILFTENLVTWRGFCALGAIAPALAIVSIWLLPIPESPRYTMLRGNEDEALRTLSKLLDGDEVEALKTLNGWHEERLAPTPRDDDRDRACGNTWGTIAQHAWLISMLVWVARAGCGVNFATTYFTLILSSGMTYNQSLSWVSVGYVLKLLATIPSSVWLVEVIGRRPLLIASSLGCLLTTGGVTVLFAVSADMVLVACFLILFWLSFAVGLGPVPFVYTAEILPNRQRAKASAWSWIPGELVAYTLLAAGPALLQLHPSFAFGLLAGINGFSVIFFWACCPETKGLLLEEAKDVFQKVV